MSNAQKTIKYLALAFAIFLIISIFSLIAYGVSFLGNIFDEDSNLADLTELKVNDDVIALDLDLKSVSLKIVKGDQLFVETNSKYITGEVKDNKLFIKEKKHNVFKNDDSILILTLPDTYFEEIKIDSGAGKLEIESLQTRNLTLDLGAGKLEIKDVIATNYAKIDGGAGELVIKNGELHNLRLDLGVGKSSIKASLVGDNKIECGIGETSLNLIGTKNDYAIYVDKGIGSASMNGETIKSETIYGSGPSKISIDGGIGSIKINIEERSK